MSSGRIRMFSTGLPAFYEILQLHFPKAELPALVITRGR